MKNNELNDRRLQATPRGIGVMCNFYAEKAENATVWDVEGNEYIDFAAGIAVLNTGHRHPKSFPPLKNNFMPSPTPRTRLCRTKAMCRLPSESTRVCRLTARPKPPSSQRGRSRRKRGKIARAYTRRPPDRLWRCFSWTHLDDHGADGESCPLQAGFRAVSARYITPNTPMNCTVSVRRRH